MKVSDSGSHTACASSTACSSVTVCPKSVGHHRHDMFILLGLALLTTTEGFARAIPMTPFLLPDREALVKHGVQFDEECVCNYACWKCRTSHMCG